MRFLSRCFWQHMSLCFPEVDPLVGGILFCWRGKGLTHWVFSVWCSGLYVYRSFQSSILNSIVIRKMLWRVLIVPEIFWGVNYNYKMDHHGNADVLSFKSDVWFLYPYVFQNTLNLWHWLPLTMRMGQKKLKWRWWRCIQCRTPDSMQWRSSLLSPDSWHEGFLTSLEWEREGLCPCVFFFFLYALRAC